MDDARLQEELLDAKNELKHLRESMSLGITPTVHEDLI